MKILRSIGQGVFAAVLSVFALGALASIGRAQDDVIQVDTRLVTVPAAVLDNQGRSIRGLVKQDFHVWEAGVEQEIAFFAPTGQGATIMVLVDNSCGMDRSEINRVVNTLAEQMNDNDSLVIGTICDDMTFRIVLRPTKKTELKRPVRVDPQGHYLFANTFDVLGQAFGFMKRFKGAKAIVLLTHGELFGRTISGKELLREAEEQDTAVYPIRFDEMPNADADSARSFDADQRMTSDNTWLSAENASPGSGRNTPGPLHIRTGLGKKDLAKLLKNVREFFQALADKTAGRSFELASITNMDETLRSIVDELGQRYTLGYIPNAPPKNGERRKIKVKVNVPDAVVRARNEVVYRKPKK